MDSPCFVYRAYDGSDRLLYVGMADDVPARMKAHRLTAKWHSQMRHHEVRKYRCRQDAKNAEYRAIRTESPLHNVVGANDVYVGEHFIRLKLSAEISRSVNCWRAENRDPETGKVVSFSEALRRLIQAGLSKPPSS